jgi:RNA polymerase sigma-70 factor (ECF subfamily)
MTNLFEFTVIYNRHKTQIYNYTLKMVSDRMTAEDIVQTVFMRFYENFGALRSVNASTSWLFTTARNEIFMHYRKKQTRVDQYRPEDISLAEKLPGELPDELYQQQEMREHIQEVLKTLPDEQRETFLLREYGGLSYDEIAKVMECETKAVKSRLHKARAKLIEKIAAYINQ